MTQKSITPAPMPSKEYVCVCVCMSVCSSGGGSVLLACVVASARHKPTAWVSESWFGNKVHPALALLRVAAMPQP
jgi:hypothetical protein